MDKKYNFIRARFLLPMTEQDGKLGRISDGFILFTDEIIDVGAYSEEKGKSIIETYGEALQIIGNNVDNPKLEDLVKLNGVIMPGFVKTHGHDHESVLIGVARDVPLTQWLDESVNPFSEFLHNQEKDLTKKLGKSPYFIAYRKARVDDISFGITTALTHHCNFNKYHVNELVEANDEVGTHIFIGVGSQDRNYYEAILDEVDEAIARLDTYFEKHKDNSRVHIIPGPDQLFSNGPKLLKALKQWARDHSGLIHIHSSEEPKTTKWFTETYGQTPVEYAQSIDILDENTMLAHQVNTTEQDVSIIAKHNSMVVHNSLANTVLGSGIPPIMDMIDAGIRLSISTDGSGSADCQNMLSAARLASQYQKAYHQDAKLLDAEDVLKRVTKIPAKMLKINAGTLEIGKDADIIVVDLSVPNLTPTREETVVENLIWASAGNEISHVIANGELLIDNYEFLSVEIDEVLHDIQLLADLFEKYKEKAPQIKGTGANL